MRYLDQEPHKGDPKACLSAGHSHPGNGPLMSQDRKQEQGEECPTKTEQQEQGCADPRVRGPSPQAPFSYKPFLEEEMGR